MNKTPRTTTELTTAQTALEIGRTKRNNDVMRFASDEQETAKFLAAATEANITVTFVDDPGQARDIYSGHAEHLNEVEKDSGIQPYRPNDVAAWGDTAFNKVTSGEQLAIIHGAPGEPFGGGSLQAFNDELRAI